MKTSQKRKEEFTILAYWCPPPTDQQYAWMKEAGFNTLILDDKYDQKEGSAEVKKAVCLADKYGITAYVGIRWDPWEITTTADRKNDYTGIKHFGGYYSDEPRKRIDLEQKMPSILKTMERYPNAEYFVTLATCIDPYFDCETIEETVEYYMENFGKNHRIFSIDFYPITSYGITENWLERTEIFAQAAKKYGKDLYCFISTMSISGEGHGPAAKITEREMRYQIYANLAYGAKGIEYFCYMTPGTPPFDGEFSSQDIALVWAKDYKDLTDYSTYERTENWYAAKRINQELKLMEKEYLSFDWQGVMAVRGSQARTNAGKALEKAKLVLSSHPSIKKLECSEDTLIGCFENEKGENAFMLTNFSDPRDGFDDKIKIQFTNAIDLVQYMGNEKKKIVLNDGVYELLLKAGEAAFVVINDKK